MQIQELNDLSVCLINDPQTVTHEEKIYLLIQKELEKQKETKPHRLTLSFKTFLALGAILGRVPFIPLCTRLFSNQKVVGELLATANLVSYSAYVIWASLKMVDKVRVDLNAHRQNKIKKTAQVAFSLIQGTIAQSPLVFLAYFYNQQNPVLVGLTVLDLVLPSYSMDLLISKFLEKSKDTLNKNQIISFLRNRQFELITQNKEHHLIRVEDISEVLKQPRIQKTDRKLVEKIQRVSAQILGISLTAVQLGWVFFLSYMGTGLVTESEALKIALGIYTAFCNAMLLQTLLIDVSSSFISGLKNWLLWQKNPLFFSESLSYKLSAMIKFFCIIVSLCSFAPAYSMSKDYLMEELVIPSAFLYGLGYVFLDYYPLRDLLEELALKSLGKWGSADHKKKINAHFEIQELILALESIDPKEFKAS